MTPGATRGPGLFQRVPAVAGVSAEIFKVFIDRRGTVWSACGDDLCVVRNGRLEIDAAFRAAGGRSPGPIVDSAAGDLWVSTLHGLFRRRPDGTWRVYAVQPVGGADGVGGVAIDGEGRLWIATGWGFVDLGAGRRRRRHARAAHRSRGYAAGPWDVLAAAAGRRGRRGYQAGPDPDRLPPAAAHARRCGLAAVCRRSVRSRGRPDCPLRHERRAAVRFPERRSGSDGRHLDRHARLGRVSPRALRRDDLDAVARPRESAHPRALRARRRDRVRRESGQRLLRRR